MKKIKQFSKKSFVFSWGIYPFDVMVTTMMPYKEVIKKIEKTDYILNQEEKDALNMDCSGRTTILRGGQIIIQLQVINAWIIAHEAFHAVCFLMDKCGIEFDNNKKDETFAYALEFCVNKIYEKLKLNPR